MDLIEGPAYDLRAEIYDCFIGDRSDEIAGWAALAAPYGRRVIEWMCGTGEVARGLARAGFETVGVDSVPEMIAVARRRAAPPADPRWVVGDMRTVRLEGGPWDFGVIPAGSLSHLLTRDDQLRALNNARSHLRPGGGLALIAMYAPPESRPEKVRGPFEALRPGPGGAAVRMYGDFDRAPWQAGAARWIVHAERPA